MNRPYKNFVGKRIGKRVDYDWAYWYQCVDLIKQYMDECLWMGRIWAIGNANTVINNKFFSNWEKFYGVKDLMQWDIIISIKWKYGHIAIVDHVADEKIYVLEQNGAGKNSGTWLGDNAIRIKAYNPSFYSVILRCKKIFDNLQLERKFVNEKLENLKRDIKITEEYIATTRFISK